MKGLAALMGLSLHSAYADTEALQAAEAQMRASFSNAVVTDFRPSPIPGLYEAYLVDQLVYFHAPTSLLILGEIWTKDGRSLTAERRAARAAQLAEALPLDQALALGEGTDVVEFTDPDCPFCRAYHRFIEHQPVRRLVFFDTRAHPGAQAKVEHILCAPDPQAAFAAIYSGAEVELKRCPQGRRRALVHAEIAQRAGVSVTPTLYVGSTPVLGFKKAAIEALLAGPSSQGDSQ